MGEGAFSCCGNLEDVTINSKIEELPRGCFENVGNLRNIKLPSTLRRLGEGCISGVQRLNELSIPESLEDIYFTFSIATQKIILPHENKNFKLYNGALYTADMTRLLIMPLLQDNQVVNIPEGVKYLNWELFSWVKAKNVQINFPTTLLELSFDGFLCYENSNVNYQMPYFKIPDNVTNVYDRSIPLAKHVTIGAKVGAPQEDASLLHSDIKDVFDGYIYNAQSSVYLMNTTVLPISNMINMRELFMNGHNGHKIDFYTQYTYPNFTYTNGEDLTNGFISFHIPGGIMNKIPNQVKPFCKEMWEYRINRTEKGINIIVSDAVVRIDKVIINGTETNHSANGIYPITGEIGSLDVKVVFTLNSYQQMTTHYDSNFNAEIADSELTSIIPVKSIELSKQKLMIPYGSSAELSAIINPNNATIPTIEWESTNPDIATVEDGLITATNEYGFTTITARTSDGTGLTATCEVEVIEPVRYIEFDTYNYEGLPGESFSIHAKVDESATHRELMWKSEKEEVAKVDDNGNVTLVSVGSTQIIAEATDGSGVQASCYVIVNPNLVTSISISPASVTDVVGAECQLTATVMPEDATNKAIEWSSDNTEVADIDANGLLKLLSLGTATITASATDGTGVQALCSVIVNTPIGIENVLVDADTDVKIYSTTGVLLFEGRYSDAKLAESIYIVVTSDKQFKRLIK